VAFMRHMQALERNDGAALPEVLSSESDAVRKGKACRPYYGRDIPQVSAPAMAEAGWRTTSLGSCALWSTLAAPPSTRVGAVFTSEKTLIIELRRDVASTEPWGTTEVLMGVSNWEVTEDEVGDILRFDGNGKITKTSVDTTTSLRVPPTVEVAKFDGRMRRFRVQLDERPDVANVAYREGGTLVNGVYSLNKGLPRVAALQDIEGFVDYGVTCEVSGMSLVPKITPKPWNEPL